MVALVTADWHLTSNPKDVYRHWWVAGELLELVKKHRPRQLIVLGDLTDQKDCHSAELVNDIVAYLAKLADECELYILRGNHDCLNPLMPFFGFVKHIPNIKWITEPDVFHLEGLGDCAFLPHTRDYKKDFKVLNLAPYKRNPERGWIFCHNTFQGANGGHSLLEGIPTDALPDTGVISGDVHVPQKLDQITYVGAPYTVTFGDNYVPRVLMIGLDQKNRRQMQSIKCTGPRKLTIDFAYKDGDLFPDLEIEAGDMCKVRVTLKANHYAKWNEIKAAVKAWIEGFGAHARGINAVKSDKAIKLARPNQTSLATDKEYVGYYAKRNKLSTDMLKTGMWLMEK